MNKWMFLFFVVASCGAAPSDSVTVGPWVPLFQGVELATGQQVAQASGERNHQVLCYRVDLTDPTIELFTTPKCTNCIQETLSEGTSHFLEQYQLQVAINGGFYSSSSGPNDTPLGTPDDVFGLAISKGALVSPANNASYAAALLFTTNNMAIFVPTNSPPTNTSGIFTAISGNRPLLINGVNVQAPIPNDLDPRTALGISQDRRYLYLMTIDGRQPGWSDGADFYNTGEWLLRFGAYDAINVDGGGSTTMVAADCQGKAARLNRSSFVYTYGRERNIGHNFGVYARRLSGGLKDFTFAAGGTTALITWRTELAMTTQVEYGPSLSYGSSSPLDTRLTKNHAVTLTGLVPGTNYFFRALSTTAELQYSDACQFTTGNSQVRTQLFGLTNIWTYNTNNLDGTNWKEPAYVESGWTGSGPGLLYALESNLGVAPRLTAMPPFSGTTVHRTYYLRTHFNFTGDISGASLTFSNYVDDGAVFYLNGSEVRRLRMPAAPTVIVNSTAASGSPCAGQQQSGDALTICPDVFTITGDALTNLVQGDNVLAVEVHNLGSGADLVFGTALILNRIVNEAPQLYLWMEDDVATIFWNGEGFTLQQSSELAPPVWSDVPGPVTQSPFTITNAATRFFRLRN